ncbi:MAG: hypothetical protein IKO75_11510 [Bacteroidales bacterium]|nr:hypothetical protein [Bacteroidales bacterium]MBR6904667.1 hypothetical protein [Bacteroidales bacterium]
MGTLFNQPERLQHFIDREDLLYEVDKIIDVAEDSGLDIDKVIDIYKAASINRFIDCYVEDGDAFDEQIAGIGEILKRIENSISNISCSLEEAFPQNS